MQQELIPEGVFVHCILNVSSIQQCEHEKRPISRESAWEVESDRRIKLFLKDFRLVTNV